LIPTLQQTFKHITDVFEYAWYGQLNVSEDDFFELKEDVLNFQKRL